MLGVLFAITGRQERQLLAAADEDDADAVSELVETIEESWEDDDLTVDLDKAWDAIHRSLAGGTLDPDGGDYPLSFAILGGRHLHEDEYVVYVDPSEVRDVALALGAVDEEALRHGFDAIDDSEYLGAGDDDDFAYTWSNFTEVREFYERAAAAGRAVLFTAM
jgi:hypothetical protein